MSSIAANSARVLAAQVVGNAGYLVAVLLLARALTPTGRGTVAFITVTALVTARLATVGVPDATKVFAAQRPAVRARLLSNLFVAATVGALGGALVSCSALVAIPGARPAGLDATALALIAAGTLASAVSAAGYAFLHGCSRFRAYTLVQAGAPWLYALGLVVVWSWRDLTAERAVLVWVLAQALPAAALAVLAARGVGLGRPSRRLLREAISFGVRAWLGSLAHFLNARADQIVIGLIAAQATLGTYAVAVNGAEVLLYLPSAVAAALLPAVAGSPPELRVERTVRVFRPVMLVTVAAALVAAALGPLLLPLAFGDAYRDSVEPFLWLLPGAVGFAASAVFSNALLASSSPGLSSLGPLVSLVVGLALDLVLIPRFGASGAAAAASAALLAGGATAAAAYRSRAALTWAALVPRRADVVALRALARRLLSRPVPTGP